MAAGGRKLVTWQQCADELGCHKNTIGDYMDRGELKYLFIGGRRRLTQELWDDFMEGRKASGPLVDVGDDDDDE